MKKFTKGLATFLAIVLLCATFCACDPGEKPEGTDALDETTEEPSDETTPEATTNREEKEAPDPYEKRMLDVLPSIDKLKLLGRTVKTGEGVAVDWSASGIEFNVDCKGDVAAYIRSTANATFAAYVDGQLHKTVKVSAGLKAYNIANDLEEGVHTIRLIKLNAAEIGSPLLNSVTKLIINGTLLDRPADSEKLIEFIGDSITCGYGTNSATDHETNASLSYAYLTASELGCDYSLISVSAIGLGKSLDRHGQLTMAKLYPYTNYYRDNSQKYTAERQADLVVIALNTNDNSSKPTEAVYKESARSLINSIYEIHGEDVKIVWIFAMMSSTANVYDQYAKDVIAEFGGEAKGLYWVTGVKNNDGAAGHPSAAGQKSNAEILTMFIRMKKLLG